MASRLREPIVKYDEGQRLAHFMLQKEAAGQLYSVAGSKAMAKKEHAGVCRNLRGELDDN